MRFARVRPVLNAPPIEEKEIAVASALNPLEELLGDNLVGVDVFTVEVRDHTRMFTERLHESDSTATGLKCHLRTSVKWPDTAAAAAIMGLTRWVRPPRPWRPSKLRLLVEAQRSPGARMSAFIPRHMEHPDSRHSNPASRKILCNPSCSAACLMACEPGTTMARTFGFTC